MWLVRVKYQCGGCNPFFCERSEPTHPTNLHFLAFLFNISMFSLPVSSGYTLRMGVHVRPGKFIFLVTRFITNVGVSGIAAIAAPGRNTVQLSFPA